MIVRASVRIGGCAISQRMPSAISRRRPLRSPARSAAMSPTSVATRVTSTAPSAKQAALVANGRAMPTVNRKAPIGGPTNKFVSRNEPWRRALPIPRSLARYDAGQQAAAAHVGKDLRGPEDEQRQQHDGDTNRSSDDRQREDCEAAARARLTTATIRRRSNRSAIAPAGRPNRRFGSCCASTAIDTSSGSRVRDATSNGPAARAIPSPTLADQRRGQQPAEAAAESTGRDGFGDAGREEGHRAEDSNALAARSSPGARLWTWRIGLVELERRMTSRGGEVVLDVRVAINAVPAGDHRADHGNAHDRSQARFEDDGRIQRCDLGRTSPSGFAARGRSWPCRPHGGCVPSSLRRMPRTGTRGRRS